MIRQQFKTVEIDGLNHRIQVITEADGRVSILHLEDISTGARHTGLTTWGTSEDEALEKFFVVAPVFLALVAQDASHGS